MNFLKKIKPKQVLTFILILVVTMLVGNFACRQLVCKPEMAVAVTATEVVAPSLDMGQEEIVEIIQEQEIPVEQLDPEIQEALVAAKRRSMGYSY